MRAFFQSTIILIVLILFAGCSGGRSESPVEPSGNPDWSNAITETRQLDNENINHFLIGYWEIILHTDTGGYEIIPVRNAEFHCNVIEFFTEFHCMTLELQYENWGNGRFNVDFTISHPLPYSEYMIFDMRGIIFGGGPSTMASKDDPDLLWLKPDGFKILNADGWTRWWNPNEFSHQQLLGYIEAFGTPGFTTDATMNPYKCFANALSLDDPVIPAINDLNRASFATDGGTVSRRYKIKFPMLGGTPDIQFQMAFDACWDEPGGGASVPSLDNYPMTANCPEAYYIDVDSSASTLYYNSYADRGGNLVLDMKVYDWGGLENPQGIGGEIAALIVDPTDDSPLFDQPVYIPGSEGSNGVFHVIIPSMPSGPDDQQVLVSVQSSSPNTYAPPIPGPGYPNAPLAAHRLADVPVATQSYIGIIGGSDSLGEVVGIKTIGYINYVLDTIEGLKIYDVYDPANPQLLKTVAFDPSYIPKAMDVQNGHAFVVHDFGLNGMVDIVDVEPYISAGVINSIPLPGLQPESIDAYGDYAYMVHQGSTLVTLGIWDPPNASIMNYATITCPGQPYHVYVKDDFVYVAEDMEVFDRSTPTAPVSAKVVSGTSNSRAVTVDDNGYAFVANNAGQIKVVDVDPVSTASVVDTYDVGDQINAIFSDSGFVYMTTDADELYVTHFNQYSEMLEFAGKGVLQTHSAPVSIYVEGNKAYVGCTNGVEIFELWDESDGWAQTWGGVGYDKGVDIVTAQSGNVYVTGYFEDTLDFDPGPATDYRTATGGNNSFLVMYDSQGKYQWVQTWGDGGDGYPIRMINSGSNLYIVGYCNNTCDLDPGAGNVYVTANSYISIFNLDGSFSSAIIYDNVSGNIDAENIFYKSTDLYVTGTLYGSDVDINPGAGSYNLSSYGDGDIFVQKLDYGGNLTWGFNIGDSELQGANGITVDAAGNQVFVSGIFEGTNVDFAPGVPYVTLSSNGGMDCFLACYFDVDGSYFWGYSWGGSNSEFASDIWVDSFDNIMISGAFQADGTSDPVDFDPFSMTDEFHYCNGSYDAFVTRFNSSGTHLWAHTWGSTGVDIAWGNNGDSTLDINVCGSFEGTVDFDQDGSGDTHSSNGAEDIFISRFDYLGNFYWSETWGGSDEDIASKIATDTGGNIYTTGTYMNNVDFEPGSGTDEHYALGITDSFLLKVMPDGTWYW